MNAYLVTGAAGFIGYHVCEKLLAQGHQVVGIDNLNDYYTVQLKHDRLANLTNNKNFHFQKLALEDREGINQLFSEFDFTKVINMAAQAGVRYSIENPYAYIDSNLVGFTNILEACRQSGKVEHLVFASSSSVYGQNTNVPFSVHHNVDHPISLYAATKKANELMAHTYSHLYRLPTTGLRFFTVYGPWGRPDMALFKFVKAIMNDEPIDVYNHGEMKRDFTYIDDIAEGVVKVTESIAKPNPKYNTDSPDPAMSSSPYKIYNIGNNNPVQLTHFIETLEKLLGKTAKKNFLPMQPGDVPMTYADVDDLVNDVGFKPNTNIEDGIKAFIDWYIPYYKKQEVCS